MKTFLIELRSLANLLLLALVAPVSAIPRVDNIRSGETIRYPVALLRGSAEGPELIVENLDSHRSTRSNRVPVEDGRFVALVELVPGRNRLVLKSGEAAAARLDLGYRPMTTPYRVQFVYLTARGFDGRYDSPDPNEDYDFRARLDVAAKLMQTFTAEVMNAHGFGRLTFPLELGSDGRVRVHEIRMSQPVDELRALEPGDLWRRIYRELERRFPTSLHKSAVVVGFTRYDPETRQARAHFALGGGGLAAFGGATLHAWPTRLQDVYAALSDSTRVDPSRAFDDSGGRGTRWALVATGIGALLHELGHTFGLPHIDDPYCIMSRGFDHIGRFFVLREAPSARHPDGVRFSERERAHWNPYFAAQLAASRWFRPDARAFEDRDGPRLERNDRDDRLRIVAPHGIRFVGVQVGDPVRSSWHESPAGVPRDRTLSIADLRERLRHPEGPFDVLVIDDQGNLARLTVE